MNTTRLDPDKAASVARIAQYCIRNTNEIPDKVITQQIIKEGIRKIHDAAQSSRGRGKYLGHGPWPENALELLPMNGGTIRAITKNLTHEHVVPVRVQAEKLLGLTSDDPLSAYENCIRHYSVDWNHKDQWARYKKVGIYDRIVFA